MYKGGSVMDVNDVDLILLSKTSAYSTLLNQKFMTELTKGLINYSTEPLELLICLNDHFSLHIELKSISRVNLNYLSKELST